MQNSSISTLKALLTFQVQDEENRTSEGECERLIIRSAVYSSDLHRGGWRPQLYSPAEEETAGYLRHGKEVPTY